MNTSSGMAIFNTLSMKRNHHQENYLNGLSHSLKLQIPSSKNYGNISS